MPRTEHVLGIARKTRRAFVFGIAALTIAFGFAACSDGLLTPERSASLPISRYRVILPTQTFDVTS